MTENSHAVGQLRTIITSLLSICNRIWSTPVALKGQARNAEMIVFGIILLLERSHFSDVGRKDNF